MKIFVSLVDPKGKKKTFALTEKPILIGRSKKAHVTLADELASSTHCLVYIKRNQVFIEDQNSKNGIFLNGIKVLKQRIYIDDNIKIGNSFLSFATDRLDPNVIKILTPEGCGNKASGGVDIQLETSKFQFKSPKKINDKLYEGVEDNQKKLSLTPMQKKLLSIREIIANLIDFLLSISLVPIPFIAFYFYDTEKFREMFLTDENLLNIDVPTITSTVGLSLIILSALCFIIFNRINRKKLKTSIGERLMGLS